VKKCIECHKEKKEEEFHFRNKIKNIRRERCKECRCNSLKEYYKLNEERIKSKSQTQYNLNRRKKINYQIIYEKQRRKIDPIFRISLNFKNMIRRAFKTKKILKDSKTFEMLGFSSQNLYKHLHQYIDKSCKECNVIITLENSHIDHIKPKRLAKSKEDIIELNQLINLRLICSQCNLKKNGKYNETFKH